MSPALSQEDIRPASLEQGKLEALAQDLAYLRARQGRFVAVDCPGCGAGAGKPAFAKHGFAFLQCPRCQTAYMSPRPSAALLADFYRDSELYAYWGRHIFPASQAARLEGIVRPRVQRILALGQAHGLGRDLMVEVGPGYGTFCQEMARRGVFQRVLAVEPHPELAAACAAPGVEVLPLAIEQAQTQGLAADLVVAFEVLEHLFSPRDFLAACARITRPGGLLVVTCPNYLGFEIATLGPASDSLDHEHINLFNPAALAGLARACGFEPLEVLTPGQLDADMVRQKALAGVLDLSGQPFLRAVLLERWDDLGGPFQDFLACQGLSSHMWLVARRAGAGEAA